MKPINQPTNQSTNQSINQPNNQPTKQTTNHQPNQNQSQITAQSINQPTSRAINLIKIWNHTLNQSIKRSMHQQNPINQQFMQSSNPSTKSNQTKLSQFIWSTNRPMEIKHPVNQTQIAQSSIQTIKPSGIHQSNNQPSHQWNPTTPNQNNWSFNQPIEQNKSIDQLKSNQRLDKSINPSTNQKQPIHRPTTQFKSINTSIGQSQQIKQNQSIHQPINEWIKPNQAKNQTSKQSNNHSINQHTQQNHSSNQSTNQSTNHIDLTINPNQAIQPLYQTNTQLKLNHVNTSTIQSTLQTGSSRTTNQPINQV